MSEQDAAQLEVEAAGTLDGVRRTVTFGSGADAVELELPRKWKRLKLLKAMSRMDIWAALEAVWPPIDGAENPALAKLEDLDLDEDELVSAVEQLGLALGGTSPGNSRASQS